MASNIRVTLEIDNKKYLADLKTAESATKTFANNAGNNIGGLTGAFGKVGGGIDILNKRMLGLKTVIASLAFGTIGRGAIQMADALKDLSDSSGIAVGRLVEFRDALQQSGGEAESLPQAISALLRSLDEAAGGSVVAQNNFQKLGVTLNDLRKLGEEDLLVATLKGIAALPTATERATAMMNNFGKSFKTVDAQTLLEQLEKLSGSGDKYAQSIERAAKLNDALAKTQSNLKLAFLEAFTQPLTQINTFFENVNNGSANMDKLISAIKLVGIAIATAFAVTGGLAIVTFIGQIGRAFSVITKIGAAFTAGGALAPMGGFFAASGAFMVGLRGAIVLIASLGTAIYAASQLFDDFGSIVSNALARAVEEIGLFAASILNLPTDAATGFLKLFDIKIDNPFGLGDGLKNIVGQAQKARQEVEKTQTALNARKNFAATDERRVKPDKPTAGDNVREVDTTARDNAIKQIREMTAEYEKSRLSVLNRLDLETQLVGKSEEEKQLLQEQRNLALEYQNAQEALIKRRETLGKEEKYLAGVINEQIKKNADGYAKQAEELTKTVTAQQTANLLEKDRLANIERITQAYERQQKIQEAVGNFQRSLITQQKDTEFQGAQQKRSPFERQVADIKEQSKKAAQEAATAFSAAFDDGGDGMGAETAKQFADGLAKIYDGYKKIEEQQVAQLEYSKTWQAGWEEAFNAYKENSQDSADTAKQAFATFTGGIEDAFVKFVQTGKLSFKDLINSMIADFAKLQAKKALSGLMDMGGGAGGGFGSLFGGIGKLFGFADGGNPPMGKASIVGERGAELLIPRNASTVVPLEGLGGGGGTSVTYNINATDAASFKQMLAREPEFLFAVTESGRRNMPTRSRR